VASPWTLYQVWAFIAPGLYKRERRMAAPFILTTAGLFIAGGFFAYFVAFRFGLEFLLGLGLMNNVQPMVTITEYFDLFVKVTLGVALVFELPVLIFFLTLIRVASPQFLLRHSRYAILAIVIAAAIITPTPDVFNLMLFAIPMNLLYFMGLFASFLLVMKREGRSFPWRKVLLWTVTVLIVLVVMSYVIFVRLGYKPVPHWPFLFR
jgi:sec-independent protein translocase protein TatC